MPGPYPDNLSDRIWIDYTSGGIGHSMLLRFENGTLFEPDVDTRLSNIIAGMQAAMWSSDSVVGCRASASGTNFSLPYLSPIGPGLLTAGTPNPESNAGFIGVAGRSTGGRGYHANFYTQDCYSQAVYRILDGSIPTNWQDWYSAMVSQIGAGDGTLVANDNLPMTFKAYVNIGQNAYWQRQSR